MPVKHIGRFWRLDADGFIENDAAPGRIPPAYRDPLAEARYAYLEHLGDRVHSIYVRGTVARGMAISGVSDLDDFALLHRHSIEPDPLWSHGIAERLLTRYPFITGVGLECLERDAPGLGGRFCELGLLMVTQTTCVWGEDVIPKLPRYKPGVLVANSDLCQIRPDVEEALAEIQASPSREQSSYWCRRIAKNLVRSGFSLTLVDERRYTRDLYPCYRIFARHYPEHERNMRRSVEYALTPSPDAEEVTAYLKDFGRWLIEEAESWLAKHNPSREPEPVLEKHHEEVRFPL